MSWKETKFIKREEAIRLIVAQMIDISHKTNDELEEMLRQYGYGGDSKLEHYGCRFIVIDP